MLLVVNVCDVKCDFENGLCKWKFPNTNYSLAFPWTRNSGTTVSTGTGPSNDHTKINSTAGNYIINAYILLHLQDKNTYFTYIQ